ncbi:MAG: tetraacyldisaccharide 4'-kinase, partial [Nitrospinaceae bacterium]
MTLQSLFFQVIGPKRRFYHQPMYWGLCWVSWAYAWAQRLRGWLYARGMIPTRRLRAPVISVGNLTLGGTGKTPVVMWIAETLRREGFRPAILSRGYGAEAPDEVNVVADGESVLMDPATAGDEPVMMARRLRGIPVLTGPSRYRLGLHAQERLQADVLILDDGFQHLGLARDLNLLLLDHRAPVGNGRVFPAGELREPVKAAHRADAVMLTRCRPGAPDLDVKTLVGRDAPLIKTALTAAGLHPLDGDAAPGDGILGKPAAAFCGIGQPDDFFGTLETMGVRLTLRQGFPDHYDYPQGPLEAFAEAARREGAKRLVTTEKDAVKLEGRRLPLPVWVLKLDLKFLAG